MLSAVVGVACLLRSSPREWVVSSLLGQWCLTCLTATGPVRSMHRQTVYRPEEQAEEWTISLSLALVASLPIHHRQPLALFRFPVLGWAKSVLNIAQKWAKSRGQSWGQSRCKSWGQSWGQSRCKSWGQSRCKSWGQSRCKSRWKSWPKVCRNRRPNIGGISVQKDPQSQSSMDNSGILG